MSRVHEALTRGRGSARHGSSVRSGHPDAVLATLGFRSDATPPAGDGKRRAVAAALAIVLAVTAYGVWRIVAPTASSAGAADTAAAADRARAANATPPANPASHTTPRPRAQPSSPVPGTAPASVRQTAPSVQAEVEPSREPVLRAPTAKTAADRPRVAPANSARDEFRLALSAQRAGNLDAARRQYARALAADPASVEAHNNLGLLYRTQGRLDEAAREFRAAIEVNAAYARAHNNLGVVLLEQGRPDAAAAEFRSVLAIEPASSDAMVNLALALRATGELVDARAELLRALTVQPDNAAAHYNLAVEYDRLGEAGRAVEHYRAFLDHLSPAQAPRAADVRARIAELSARVR